MYTSILNLYFIYNLKLVFIRPPSLRSPGHPARSSLYFFVISKINIYSSPLRSARPDTPPFLFFFVFPSRSSHFWNIITLVIDWRE